ncbi:MULTISPECIES: esterase [unclassified Nocardia]|uniref:LGFP repeat-containing protein n=1 Tax=unclassified Nocardia TaxID=2637762 RepID=UPI0024A90D27|nr:MULTISPECIES: esterase [unclassified Nocardia]
MHHFARRTAGFMTAIALVALPLAGCAKDDKDAKPDTGMATTTAMATATEHTDGHSDDAHDNETDRNDADRNETDRDDTPTTKIPTAAGDIEVSGSILEKYNAVGGVTSPLGEPTGESQDAPGGGTMQAFEGGAIYSSPDTGAHIVWGEIRDAWMANGGPGGKLGYPTSDEMDIAGGKQSDFTGGTITWVDRQITVTEK